METRGGLVALRDHKQIALNTWTQVWMEQNGYNPAVYGSHRRLMIDRVVKVPFSIFWGHQEYLHNYKTIKGSVSLIGGTTGSRSTSSEMNKGWK